MRLLMLVCAFALTLTGACAEAQGQGGGVTRTYYIAADDVIWDYAPTGKDEITGQPFNAFQAYFAEASDYRLGRKLKKALYLEYSDATFTKRKARPPEWEHLGWLGPLIRAEVGDTIRVVFKNNTQFPASMHPHGVFYEKDSEGALYRDGTEGAMKADDAVPPGGSHTYKWVVPERAGPVPGGPSSAFWMYHSHSSETRDLFTGLVGPMIITARGQASENSLRPKDVDREFIVAFMSTEEASSWYAEDNIRRDLGRPSEAKIVHDQFGSWNIATPKDTTLEAKDNMNGFIYGNLPMLTMKRGERVRWYLMTGAGFEVHAPHWHGNTGIEGHMRVDTVSLTTMGMTQIDMIPDAVGTWLFHCHVNAHMDAGMIARYQVLP
jgi:FtsP/CotA-like multicopper oxidase with cupredoxin domain